MASAAVQLLGYALALVGLAASIAATFMVEWKKYANIEGTSVTTRHTYEGLWMACIVDASGSMTCHPFHSLFQLKTEVQVTRALMLLSILASACGALVTTVGMKCTKCLDENRRVKGKVAMTGGVLFLLAGLLALSVTSWYASKIFQSFYGTSTPQSHRYEFGNAVFVSWGGAFLSLVGGALLCCSRCPGTGERSSVTYSKTQVASPGTDYV